MQCPAAPCLSLSWRYGLSHGACIDAYDGCIRRCMKARRRWQQQASSFMICGAMHSYTRPTNDRALVGSSYTATWLCIHACMHALPHWGSDAKVKHTASWSERAMVRESCIIIATGMCHVGNVPHCHNQQALRKPHHRIPIITLAHGRQEDQSPDTSHQTHLPDGAAAGLTSPE